MGKMDLHLYTPHEAQLAFHQSKARYRVASWGRQSGKSTACLNDLLYRAWENPKVKYWFISPTFEQAKDQYRRLVGMLSPCWEVLLKKNQSELRVKLINQSEIVFKSGEVLHNLRGSTLDGVVIDEVRDQPPELWSQVIRAMITTTQGWAAFVSTPSGFDQFKDFFDRGVNDPTGLWQSFQAPSTCNPLFTSEEYEAAKKEMSEAEFAQEINAEFRDIHQGKVYINHGPQNQMECCPWNRNGELYSEHLPILLACDFNLSPMAWALGQERAGTFYFFDEIFLKGSHTQEAAKELCERVKHHKQGITIVGDATGKAGQRAAAGKSDYYILEQTLKDHGIPFVNKTPDSNPQVKDRINTMNAKLKAADGSVSLYYHPKRVPHLKRDFERVSWKSGSTLILDQVKDKELTHISDGVGYSVCALSSQWNPKPGGLRVISR